MTSGAKSITALASPSKHAGACPTVQGEVVSNLIVKPELDGRARQAYGSRAEKSKSEGFVKSHIRRPACVE